MKLERGLSLSEQQDRIFAVKNVLTGSVAVEDSNCGTSDEIELLDLAESLLNKLGNFLKSLPFQQVS
ncbi:MAG: hypothetical protein V7L29_01465 [Nostoc sp.]|uniref:hypothetical protein n=1 Tax=Nostoc sp. TaxID=1180 RepID=UPI002FFB54ED